MKLISIKTALFARYTALDHEMLIKSKRPTVLVVRLKYRGEKCDFAVPLRSNIPPATPKDEYFALPNRSTTKEKHHHGLHYVKMFPVSKPFYEQYHIEGDVASKLYLAVIDKNEKQIVDACQAYLTRYERGVHPQYATDIDVLLKELKRLSNQGDATTFSETEG